MVRTIYYDCGDRVCNVDTFFRDITALVIANLITGANLLFSGELPYGHKRVDHLGYKVSPIISYNRPSIEPVIILEDSADRRRLKERITELAAMLEPVKAYIFVDYVEDRNLIIAIRIKSLEGKEFILEVGTGWSYLCL